MTLLRCFRMVLMRVCARMGLRICGKSQDSVKDKEMPLPDRPAEVLPFRAGDWLIEPAMNRLSKGSESVSVEPRIMHVLTCLAARPGEVITRDELIETVWSKVMVNEEALTQAISQIRRVVGDDTRSPGFIQTIPKRGYRLIVKVRPFPGIGGEKKPASISRTRILAILGTLVAVSIAVSIIVVLSGSRSSDPPVPIALEEVPFTSYSGSEITPAVSPDGTRIAFSYKEGEDGDYDLHVKQKNTESPLRLTDTEEDEYYPAWSPDGSEIAYARVSTEGIGIYTIPAIGGTPRRVLEPPLGIAGLDWSPRGDLLAYSSLPDADQPLHIFIFSFETGESRMLTTPPPESHGDFRPAFSPEGSRIAFVRGDRTNLHDIYLMDIDGSEPVCITHSQHFVAGLDWMPDGRSLILSSGATRIADMRLWRLSIPDGSLAWLPTTSRRPIRPSVAAIAGKMVYEDQSISSDILEIDLSADGNEPLPLIASTRHDYGPQYSPSGRLISFISTRSGGPQIWVCDRDGSSPRQLTRFERAYIENPCWSHDDRFVAFSAAPGNQTSIYVADVESGEVKGISASASHEKCLGWSRDGEWIYCKSERDGTWWVWKTRPDGGGTQDIMDRNVFRLAESLDGERLVYSRTDTSGVWTCGLGGEDERCLVDEPGTVVPCGWRESESGLYSFCFQEGVFTLMFRDAATGIDSVIASGPDLVAVNLDVCPRGEAVVVDRFEILGSDLYIVDQLP